MEFPWFKSKRGATLRVRFYRRLTASTEPFQIIIASR